MTMQISLSSSYDLSTRFRIFFSILSEFDYLSRTRGLKSVSAAFFHAHLERTVINFLSRGHIFMTEDGKESFDNITPRTLSNFLALTQKDISSVHDGTFRFFDSFLKVQNESYRTIMRSSSDYVRSLANDLARFFTPFDGSQSHTEFSAELISAIAGTYMVGSPPPTVTTPSASKFAILYLRTLPGGLGLFCHYVPVPRPIGFSRFDFEGKDLSDWCEDRYSGIGVATRDGVVLHLASFSTKLPVYLLIKTDAPSKKGMPIILTEVTTSDSSRGIAGYMVERLTNPAVELYFDEIDWII